MNKELYLQKVAIARNTNFINQIVSKADIKPGEKIAVAYWATPAVYWFIKNKYPDCDIYYIDTAGRTSGIDKNHIIIISEEDFKNKVYWPNMKFDKIIINPPYGKTLHLHILRKAIKQLNSEGIIINLSPVRWLQDPFAMLKKSSTLQQFNDICTYISDISIVNREIANKLFGIGLFSDLGLYTISAKQTNFDYTNYWKTFKTKEQLSILNKVCLSNCTKLSDVIELSEIKGLRVPVTDMAGNRGNLPIYKDLIYVKDGKLNDKHWTKLKNMGGYDKKDNSNIPESIKFNSVKEATNFYDSIKTNFYRYICLISVQQQHIQTQYLPFMRDYTHPWTDERFYKYFNITEEEQNIIEATMKEYE